MSKVIGIDISKETFDVAFTDEDQWCHKQFSNNAKGFSSFFKLVSTTDHCIMEASGPYYLQLAVFLFKEDIKVSVVNPLVIHRFAQMRMFRAKTDKKDAQIIAEYGLQQNPGLWQPEQRHIHQMRQLLTTIQLFDKQLQMSQKQLQSFSATGLISSELKKIIKQQIRSMKIKIDKLNVTLKAMAEHHYSATFKKLQTIPGIGPKTAVILIVITHNFQKFEYSRQLIAYVGLSPRIYQSGTSIKGKGRICKMGASLVRKHLYLCSWTAKKANKACHEMYERLKEKGKPERVIKIAIANKLLKQAFAIARNNEIYNENYISKPCF